GMLTFNAGTIDVNTVYCGNQSLGTSTASTTPELGIINVAGPTALFRVNGTLTLANTITASTSATNSWGRLNVTNGTANVSNIVVGANSSSANTAVNLTNATLFVSNAIATSAKRLTNFFTANSLLGLTITADAAAKAFVGTMTTAGATNVIQLATNPAVFFTSYPTQFALVKYATLNSFNVGLTNIPAWTPGAYLSNYTANLSVDLVLPNDPRPVLTANPASYSGAPGDNVTFSVAVNPNSVTPLSYQWKKDGVALTDGATGNGSTISGATASSLTLTSAQPGDNASAPGYACTVTNLYGSASSSAATLTIAAGDIAPGITGPTNQTVIASNTATLVASVTGSPVPATRWQFNGNDLSNGPTGNGDTISGSTSSTLTITSVQYPSSQGTYSIIASNTAGQATNSMTLTVIVPPTISSQPTNLTVLAGNSATFYVTTSGVPSPGYTWKKNGSPISGATSSSYNIASVAASDIATYTVVVTNAAGTVTSSGATLTVTSAMTATTLSPGNNATGVCYDTPLYITFSAAPQMRNAGTIRIFNATNTVTPVDTLDLSQNVQYTQTGTSIPSYLLNVQPRTIAGATYTNFPVIISGNTAAIYPHLGVMTSNKTYYVTVDTGVFTDSTGAYFAGITDTNAWRFSTKLAGPPVGTNYVVVAGDGSADFATVQGAVDFLPNASTNRVIYLRNGVYQEIVNIPVGKNNLTLRGENRQLTRLQYHNSNIMNANSHQEMVLHVRANDVAIENLKLTNSVPQGGSQSFALMVETGAKRFICNNADVDSYQDTILVNTTDCNTYFYNSLIQGDVDYIWGGGNCFFTNCEIRSLRAGSVITQSRT
ncbi:MAG TPA: pectinesterase family protein, partial [Verrucomicrobiae bacterium]